VVLEADEFDRSFLWLSPSLALISAMDADHLDIYGSHQEVENAFGAFARRVKSGGVLVMKKGLPPQEGLMADVEVLSYALADSDADYYAGELVLEDGLYRFSLHTPQGLITDLKMGIPGRLNVENAIGAVALALNAGVEVDEIRAALPGFKGIARRFDLHVNAPHLVYIDDYAHHPEEIRATLTSVRALYPGFRLCGVFQPHLYTRTRDFAEDFAQSLSLLDEVLLMDIYPARELPLPGITARTIGEHITEVPVGYVGPEDLPEVLQPGAQPTVVLTMGAGDIDRLVPRIAAHLAHLVSLR
jgi:UDP-N-acetylmuramate--alanine ligase